MTGFNAVCSMTKVGHVGPSLHGTSVLLLSAQNVRLGWHLALFPDSQRLKEGARKIRLCQHTRSGPR
jgi:hypothetical protein